jgi:hypothetical protein
MVYSLFADAVVLAHFGFILFVVFGGLAVIWWRQLAWLHLPAVCWAAVLEFQGLICPLTPLENWLRRKTGGDAYQTGFIEHYILPMIYPAGLTADVQMFLGVGVLVINAVVYVLVIYRWRRSSRA